MTARSAAAIVSPVLSVALLLGVGACTSFYEIPIETPIQPKMDVSMFQRVLIAGFIGPRVALFIWWVFGDKVDAAFSSWIWPLLGLLFLPWTTLAYVLAWGPLDGVSGLGWLVVAIGLAGDIATYSSRAAKSRYQSAY